MQAMIEADQNHRAPTSRRWCSSPGRCHRDRSLLNSSKRTVLGQVLTFARVTRRLCGFLLLDTLVTLHHDAMMRTTLDLPDDLHSVLVSLSSSNRKSMSHTAAELIRLGLTRPASNATAVSKAVSVSKRTGLPLVRFPRPISAEDVRALEDEI